MSSEKSEGKLQGIKIDHEGSSKAMRSETISSEACGVALVQ
jgi:hypothetical protein